MLFLVELGEPLHRNDKLELPSCHPCELALQLVHVPTKVLHDLWVLDIVKQLDHLGVVHHARGRPVKGLHAEVNSGAALLKLMK